ncbi:MAG TPA: hypothetical protein VFR97_12045 [Capillimicrobium sp.]|nr:hypothetical protein [Capillimicrobium sp.]
MSFLKKAQQAAMIAKERAEEAKERIDELRAERDAASVRPATTEQLDGDDRSRLAEALALGAVDPTELLSREEASELAGTELGLARIGHEDMALNALYLAEDRKRRRWSVTVWSWFLREDGGGTAAETWQALEPAREVGDPIAGLGRDAFAQDGHVFAWAGDVVFSVEVQVPDEADTRERALAAARRIAARVG